MIWVFAVIGLVAVVVIGLVVVGGETARLATVARPAVFDLAEAVDFIADRLPADSQARLSHDDVRWVLLADADLLEESTAGPAERRYPWSRKPMPEVLPDGVVDEHQAVALIIAKADADGRDITDEDIVAVLDTRLVYLEAIGAVGPEVDRP
ncbi:MAG: hypothetical protein GX643_11295 [Acidimicrobiales bacterium]|nr:hypothetical protein [Acidimicrobiales bacterium]